MTAVLYFEFAICFAWSYNYDVSDCDNNNYLLMEQPNGYLTGEKLQNLAFSQIIRNLQDVYIAKNERDVKYGCTT